MTTLTEIEELTKQYALARVSLRSRVQALEDEIRQAKRQRLPAIKKAIQTAMAARARLGVAIEDNRDLFRRPRTQVFHGVKVGYQKKPGGLSWASDERVVKLIKENLPDMAEVLIKTTEKPLKKALAGVPEDDLKRIGVRVAKGSDQVCIKPTDSEIDKLVEALLSESGDEHDTDAA